MPKNWSPKTDPSAPNWKIFNPLGNAIQEVQQVTSTIQVGMDYVNQSLEVVDSILQGVQQFISLLKIMENVVDRGIFSFLDAFINSAESLMDSIKSTGIYGLDLFSYHFKDYPKCSVDDGFLAGAEWWKETVPAKMFNDIKEISDSSEEKKKQLLAMYNSLYRKAKPLATLPELSSIIKQLEEGIKTLNTKDGQLSENDLINFYQFEEALKTAKIVDQSTARKVVEVLKYLALLKYTPETYYEWIDVICQAFVDQDDKPGKTVLQIIEKVKEKTDKDEDKEKSSAPVVSTLTTSQAPAILKTGRPLFSEGDYMWVLLVGFCVPSIEAVKDIYDSIEAIKDIFDSDVVDELKSLNNLGSTFKKYGQQWAAMVAKCGSEFSYAQDAVTYGPEPNFFGLSLNMFVGDIFGAVEQLLDKLKSFVPTNESSIFDAIDEWIVAVKSIIGFIEYILGIIEKITKFINALALLSRGFALTFDTNMGVPGVIEKLKKTQPFTTVKLSADKVMKAFGFSPVVNPEIMIATLSGASTIPEMIANMGTFRQNTIFQMNQVQEEFNVFNSEYDAIVSEKEKYDVVYAQCLLFETAFAASDYNDIYATTQAQVAIYDAQIISYTNLMNSELTMDGSKAWIATEIDSFEYEISNDSPYNSANIEAQNNIQAQIDALDTQNADINAPQIPDYVEQRAALVAQLNLLIALKLEHDTLYTDKRDRYEDVLDLINIFCTAHPVDEAADLTDYDIKIATLESDIAALKLARTNTYNAYVLTRAGYVSSISGAQVSITTKEGEIAVLQGDIGAWTAERNYRFAINPADPQIAILDAQILAAQGDITTKQGEIVVLQADIAGWQADIVAADLAQTSYDDQAVKDQEDKYLEWEALTHWRRAENYRVIKLGLEEDLQTYIGEQDAILEELKSDILAATMNVLTDPVYAETLTNLYYNEGFDTSLPSSSRVQNAISKITKSGGRLELAEIKKEISQSDLNYYQGIVNKMPEDAFNAITAELLQETEEQFNPNEKMYYGGFLFCFGVPSAQSFIGSASDLFSMASEKIDMVNGEANKVIASTSESYSETKSLIKKFFK